MGCRGSQRLEQTGGATRDYQWQEAVTIPRVGRATGRQGVTREPGLSGARP